MSRWRGLPLVVCTAAALTAGFARQSPDALNSRAVTVESAFVPLDPRDAAHTTIGDFHYAGGIAITSRDTDQLHGLSDLEVIGTDRLMAVTDYGALLEARLVFDAAERLVGLTDARLTPLRDDDGTLPTDKTDVDAEGLALLADGDRLVSFERRHRILRYPVGGDVPSRVPSPEEVFPPNAGMEALAADPESGDDAYIVGSEVNGSTWNCRVHATCTKGPGVQKPADLGLVALRLLPGRRMAYLLRGYDEVRGSRISLQIADSSTIARMDLAAPLTVDNYEGLATVTRPNGGFRFYLISDDNASSAQRTLLVAFDWRPR